MRRSTRASVGCSLALADNLRDFAQCLAVDGGVRACRTWRSSIEAMPAGPPGHGSDRRRPQHGRLDCPVVDILGELLHPPIKPATGNLLIDELHDLHPHRRHRWSGVPVSPRQRRPGRAVKRVSASLPGPAPARLRGQQMAARVSTSAALVGGTRVHTRECERALALRSPQEPAPQAGVDSSEGGGARTPVN